MLTVKLVNQTELNIESIREEYDGARKVYTLCLNLTNDYDGTVRNLETVFYPEACNKIEVYEEDMLKSTYIDYVVIERISFEIDIFGNERKTLVLREKSALSETC